MYLLVIRWAKQKSFDFATFVNSARITPCMAQVREGKQKSTLNLVLTANHEAFDSPDLCDSEVDLLVGWVLKDGLK